ncbi:hypothetical protein GCM10009836_29280 [Pseudonocardia ailaonensis]|uniref:ANTAR domain-containing protein n=2 Tax=Pseudonocardia ailaonensis TaxID=367279 RepID=A0ABN2N1E6_9PSEU
MRAFGPRRLRRTPTAERERSGDGSTDMTSASLIITGYERRLAIVTAALRTGPELSEDAARDLAVRVLAALDHIPETIR